ncbi:tumor necrosis factor receptor superfamily member 1A isoform X3 [Sander vitreus]
MEGAGHRGRWDIKSPVGTILLLMCMFIPTLTLFQPSEEQRCPIGDYITEKGICCNKCLPGFKLVEMCHAMGQRSNCTTCPDGQYTDELNYSPNCRSCRRCKGTPDNNTVCQCKENYYRVKDKCEPCKNCTDECKLQCSPPTWTTKAPLPEGGYLIKIIAGVAVMAVILLVLLILITYIVTKRTIKKKLLKPYCQPADVSVDSCERALFHIEEPSDNMTVKAVPQSPVSEQEQYNLPDCVPLEVKIPDLIYTVLDLVPVLQVKQLVRSLGVKDTEIEQAELDHRSCREAHYQMLRVWAERGSRTGGGGRGRMLHSPLLQELLEELRKMHLGRAAEELETKYGIQ